MSTEAKENANSPAGPSEEVTHDEDDSVTDRLKSLEKEYKQLSSLFHDYLADSNRDDRDSIASDHQDPPFPACEITRLSSVEWRAMQDRSPLRVEYSLLTVGPKGRGENALRNQPADVQNEAGKAAAELTADSIKAMKSSNESAYRVILNGRAELMEVLGGIFNSQALPGFYFWIWPFKYLIKYGGKVRARLLEEESKLNKENELSMSENSASVSAETRAVSNSDSTESVPKSAMSSSDNQNTASTEMEAGVQEFRDQLKSPKHKDVGQIEISHFPKGVSESNTEIEPAADISQEPQEPAINEDKAAKSAVEAERNHPIAPEGMSKGVDRARLRDELRCIVKFMDEDMKSVFSVQETIDDGTRKTIGFDYLWQLFKPGDLVIEKGEQKRAYVVLHVTGGRALHRSAQTTTSQETHKDVYPYITKEQQQEKEAYLAKYSKTTPFVVDCFYIDFDGTDFGPLPKKFMLSEYEGEVPINSLDVFPARFDDDVKQMEKALVKRGKRFVKMARVDHKYYSGRTIREPLVLETQGEVHGEIMIDFTLAIRKFRKLRYDWDVKFGTGVIANPTSVDEREMNGYYNVIPGANAQFKPTFFMEDAAYDNELRTDFTDKTSLLKERSYTEKLSTEALMLLPPRVYGFSLLDRKWYAFDLSKVDDIRESDQSFEHLVLPDDHKKIMQALVQHHTKGPALASTLAKRIDHEFSMDVIRGKGRGLIILLHGVPGVGKTSTAECVAAQTRRPLFPITCGDIGTFPEVVEERLTEYFDMAHKWGCVLLLDEADVFLAKREKGGDLQRNGIVSVFLRVLEYYSGILILTTNRIGEFDEAFSSRVHIKLYYPKLDRKSTLAIWKMNMTRIAESDLDITVKEDEIKKFAKKMWADSADKQTQRWNGRQIRNAFQTAIALAKWDHQESGNDSNRRPCLSVRQFEVVAQTSAHFDNYISTMHGIDEYADTWDTIAARDFLRKNETPRKPTSRSGAPARARGGRLSGRKFQNSDDDEDNDETDSDENEEKMRELEAELERRQKMKGPPMKKHRDGQAGQKAQKQKVTPPTEPNDEDSSSAEDEAD